MRDYEPWLHMHAMDRFVYELDYDGHSRLFGGHFGKVSEYSVVRLLQKLHAFSRGNTDSTTMDNFVLENSFRNAFDDVLLKYLGGWRSLGGEWTQSPFNEFERHCVAGGVRGYYFTIGENSNPALASRKSSGMRLRLSDLASGSSVLDDALTEAVRYKKIRRNVDFSDISFRT